MSYASDRPGNARRRARLSSHRPVTGESVDAARSFACAIADDDAAVVSEPSEAAAFVPAAEPIPPQEIPPREIELKLELPKSAMRRLLLWPPLREHGTPRAVPLVSVYYDTPEHDLYEQGLTLRVRRSGRRHVQTVKLERGESAALMNRGEWEHEVARGKPNLGLLEGTGLEQVLGAELEPRLVPLFEARMRRRTYPIESGTSIFELTVDEGEIVAGGRRAPVCEVELEVKRGDAQGLFAFARALSEHVPTQVSVTTKAERGYELIAGKGPRAAYATPVAVAPDATCRAAFQTIAGSCLRQVIANRALARDGVSEGLHQVRVGLRRLRVAITLFRDMVRDPQSETIRGELKWIVGEFGPARELDVFAQRIAASSLADASPPGVAAFVGDVRQRREEALANARTAVDSDRFRMLVLDTAAWIEAGDWTSNPDELAAALRERPVATAAAAELDRHRKKILKRAAEICALDPEARHTVRIEAKKLRYGAEFFVGVFPGKKVRMARKRLAAALGRLQDVLGELNDIAVHERLTEALALGKEPGGRKKRGSVRKAFAAGRLAGQEEARGALLLEDAERAFARFAKIKPFWRQSRKHP